MLFSTNLNNSPISRARCWVWLLGVLFPLISPRVYSQDFQPAGEFKYSFPSGKDILAGGDDAINSIGAQLTIAGFEKHNAMDGMAGVRFVNKNYFVPIVGALNTVKTAELTSDSEWAKKGADAALTALNNLKSARHIQLVSLLLAGAGPSLADLNKTFIQYSRDLEQAVNAAQAVPGQINAYVKSNHAGIQLLMAASTHQGAAYGNGMTCSDLVKRAVGELRFMLPDSPPVCTAFTTTQPFTCQHWVPGIPTTNYWFAHGMGPFFRLIYGGPDGLPLSQLVEDYMSNRIDLPIGALIVAEGHAAIFDGFIKVGSTYQLITFDANNSVGWTVSYEGTPSLDDPDDKMLSFPGHQVGEHVTKLQWGSDHRVKVYQFIARVK